MVYLSKATTVNCPSCFLTVPVDQNLLFFVENKHYHSTHIPHLFSPTPSITPQSLTTPLSPNLMLSFLFFSFFKAKTNKNSHYFHVISMANMCMVRVLCWITGNLAGATPTVKNDAILQQLSTTNSSLTMCESRRTR